jgi:DNA processing protein
LGPAFRSAAGHDLFFLWSGSREEAAMTDLLPFITLSLMPRSCWCQAAERLRRGSAADAVLELALAQNGQDTPGHASRLRSRAAAAIQAGRSQRVTVVGWNDAAYPPALTTIADPPFVLWVRGVAASLSTPAVAIVGARAASPYALAVAERLAADLAAAGLTVVSGLARGVDSAAHRGALSAGGTTIGVLGSGIDVIYPPEHGPLVRDIEKRGAVISELVPGTAPQPRFFPMRNRLISGLTRAVVVIEAGDKSGSLITARCALEQGRDVLAVPGNVLSGRNRGAHGLLRDGATIVESVDDILAELGMSPGARSAGADAGCEQRRGRRAADPVLECLTPGEPSNLDEIAERSGLSPSRLLPRLFELEVQGAVARIGGGRFVRVDSSC